MQAVAAEMNLSETAFVRPLGLDYELRWFIPAVEVDLCGHATLASAHVMWQEGLVRQNDPIRFSTRSGILTAAHNGGHIELDFPATRATEASPPSELIDALGVVPWFVGRSRIRLPGCRRNCKGSSHRLPGFWQTGLGRCSWHDRHEQVRRFPVRFYLALFCAGSWHRRRPGDRLGSLLPRTVLERKARKGNDDRLAGIGTGRRGSSLCRRRASHPRW